MVRKDVYKRQERKSFVFDLCPAGIQQIIVFCVHRNIQAIAVRIDECSKAADVYKRQGQHFGGGRQGADPPPDRQGRQGRVCGRLLRRVHLPAR